jgi:hypothetical protein
MLLFKRNKRINTIERESEEINLKTKTLLEENEASVYFDYMQYFHDENNSNLEISKVIENNLKQYSEEELQKLAVEILSMSFGKLRGLASESMPPNNNLLQAIVWHLSDAVHNLPPRINTYDNRLPFHLSEFFVFIYILDKIEMDKMLWLQRYQESSLIEFKFFKQHWEHLYM